MSILSNLNKVNLPDELFHYTTQEGLIGICESKEIWTTRILCLNDSSEYVLALNLAKKVLSEYQDGKKFPQEKIEFLQTLIECITKLHIFVTSFSENGDLLSQWRAYGDFSGGYNLGFSGPNLMNAANDQGYVLLKCIYEPEEHQKIMENLLSKYLSQDAENPTWLKKSIIRDEFWKDISIIAPIIKDEGFKEENEWRIISKIPVYPKDMSFRKGPSYIIPYAKFFLNNPQEFLRSITIGPTPHPEISADTIKMLLSKHDLWSDGFAIYYSGIPFRNW